MLDIITGILIVIFAWAYQILVGQKKTAGWIFAVLSYVVWGYAMAVSHQWAYAAAAIALGATAGYNWYRWRRL